MCGFLTNSIYVCVCVCVGPPAEGAGVLVSWLLVEIPPVLPVLPRLGSSPA